MLTNSNEDIDEHFHPKCCLLLLDRSMVTSRRVAWLTTELWMRIDSRKGLMPVLIAASADERDMFEFTSGKIRME